MSESTPNQIEKSIVLRAPRSRVWRAIADATEFGAWFGIRFNGPFVAGQTVTGTITDPPGYEHVKAAFAITRVEPEHTFAFEWHPYGIDPDYDYSSEKKTTCTFELSAHEGGTLLRLTEAGFDGVPPHRRALAFKMNDGGWAQQMERIARYVDAE